MNKTKTKATLVKISLWDKVRQKISRLNKPMLVFGLTLMFGISIAIMIGYFYSLYHDRLWATEGIRDTLTYQGKIVNGDGVPPPDGNYNLQFKIFDAQTSGNLLWTEIWDGQAHTGQSTNSQVYVLSGVFTVELNSLCLNWVGDCSSNGGVTFNQDSFYLQVELDYDTNGSFEEIFIPRKRFTATPYSMNADKLDGREATDFIMTTGGTMTGELAVPKITDNSIIAEYQFNGSAKNSSVNTGLDGSLQGGALLNDDLLNLDGTDDYVLVNDDDLLTFGIGTADTTFSFSARIFVKNNVNFPILTKGVYNTNAEYYFGTDINGKLIIKLYDESVADCYIGRMYAGSAIGTNEWLSVAVTYSGSGAEAGLKLYLNGQQIDDAGSSAVCAYTAMENLASAVYLGKYDASYANGKIENVKIQNRVLTADEILMNFNNKERYLVSDEMATFNLELRAIDPNSLDDKAGYLYYDPIFNRIMTESAFYAPNNLPALVNSLNPQDYTQFRDDNKILAYDFADTSGSSVVDLEGNANGAIGGDAYFTNNGLIGYGFIMDQSNDYISFSDPGLDTGTGSLELWAKFNNIATSETNYLVYLSETGGQQFGLVKQGLSDLYIKVGDSTLTDTAYDIPDTDWHQYVVTWDNPYFEVFVDGISIYNGNYSTFTTPTTLLLGYGNTASTSLNGYLDSVALYNRVLTDSEIINHAHSSYGTLYVNSDLKSGLASSTLENLLAMPASITENNIFDPVFFRNTSGQVLSLSFSEGFGTQTSSHHNTNLYATINGATWVKNGMYGSGMSFDGQDDYLEVADDSVLDFGTDDFAIEFWINGSSLGNNDKTVISKRSGNTGYEIYYDASSDSLRFFIGDDAGTPNTVDSAATGYDFSDGKWHHFMVNFDRSNTNTASIFRDGDYWNTTLNIDISSVSGSISNAANLFIGKDSTGNYFNGKIDSIVLYNFTTSGNNQLNFFDAVGRVSNSPDFLFVIGQNTPDGYGALSVINRSGSGSGAIIGMSNQNNTANYPLRIWNDNPDVSNIYNLLYFGTSGLGTNTEFGNLKWDAGNTKFVLNQNLELTGDLISNYIATDGNEFLAHDIIRHTITTGEAAGGAFSVAWSKAVQAKIANLRAITLDLSPTPDEVWADDWNTGFDHGIKYDGTNITVIMLGGAWATNDVVTIYIVYEK